MPKKKPSKNSRSSWGIWLRLFLVVFVLVTGFLGYRTLNQPTGVSQSPYVDLVKVIDGDTIRVLDAKHEEIKVRLIGIDAPELGTAASFQAALAAAELLEAAKTIRLEPDPDDPRDKYGRVLGWVWIDDGSGREVLLQEKLVALGLVDLYRDAAGSKYYTRLQIARQYRPD